MSKPKKQNPTPAASATTNDAPDSFVPDPAVRREFGICEMTLTRWDADEDMDFPPAIKINNRCYRSRRLLDAFKERLMKDAIERRKADRQRKAERNREVA